MKKWQVENSETSEISEKLFRVFAYFPTAKIKNSDSKISEKTFQDFREFDLVKFTSFFISNVFFSIQRQCWVIFS